MSLRLTDAHFDELCRNGFVIIERYIAEEECAQMAASLRRILPPWDEVKADPPADRTALKLFPHSQQILNRAIVDWEAIRFSQRWLGTDRVHYRPGGSIVRYPGYKSHVTRPHIDNGNNSLLPPSESDRSYGQINFWFYLEEVGEDESPTWFIPAGHGQDATRAVDMVGPPGTLAIFHNYAWHGARDYARSDGQKYIWKFAYGHADHYWEGVAHFTQVGADPHFREFVSGLSARERELFRFPPAGHPYYTTQTLEALEEQYPGWNSEGEYG